MKGCCDKGCLGSDLYSIGSFFLAHLGKEGIKRMNILYLKYGLIALGAIGAILTFASAYKTLGPPTFIDYGESSQRAGKDLSPTDLQRLNDAKRQVAGSDYVRSVKGGTD